MLHGREASLLFNITREVTREGPAAGVRRHTGGAGRGGAAVHGRGRPRRYKGGAGRGAGQAGGAGRGGTRGTGQAAQPRDELQVRRDGARHAVPRRGAQADTPRCLGAESDGRAWSIARHAPSPLPPPPAV